MNFITYNALGLDCWEKRKDVLKMVKQQRYMQRALELFLQGAKYKEFFGGKEKLTFVKRYILNLRVKYVRSL